MGDKTHASLIPFAWSAGWNSPQAWNKLQDKVGGKLKGGDVGIRLFDHLPKNDNVFEKLTVNENLSSSIADGRAVLVPIYNLFSSNALISRSPVVASQIKPAVWKISTDDAKKWLIKNGDKLTLSQHDISVTLPVQVVDYVADGCIGYPCGLVPFDVNVPTTVKKADDDTPVFVLAYQKSLKKLAVTQRRTIFSPKTGFNNMPLGQSSHQEVGA